MANIIQTAKLLSRGWTPTNIVKAAKQLSASITNQARAYIELRMGVPIERLRDFLAYFSTAKGKVWATFRACHLVGSVAMGVTFRIVDRRTGKPVKGDTGQHLIDRPNPMYSWEEMIYQWVFHMKLTGNAYWLLDERNVYGQPLYIYPLLPQFVKPIPDETLGVSRYDYCVNGKVIQYEPKNILHFRRPSPDDVIMGQGDVEGATSLFEETIGRQTLQQKFIENGAQPSGILSNEGDVDEDDLTQLKQKWKKDYSGTKNSGKTAWLTGKWNYIKLGMTSAEMEALEHSKWSIEQIFLSHGIPLSIAGIKASANYATARQEDINFRRYECAPLIDLLTGKVNAFGEVGVFGFWNENYMLDYQMAGLVDIEQITKDYGPAVNDGAMTLNEFREVCGLLKVDNPLLDNYYVNNTRIPLEMAGKMKPPSTAPKKKP